jgi:hypothetical protein
VIRHHTDYQRLQPDRFGQLRRRYPRWLRKQLLATTTAPASRRWKRWWRG